MRPAPYCKLSKGKSPRGGLQLPPPQTNERLKMKRAYRILIAKPGLDGHDRGAKVIARALRDAGMEIIYLGLRQTPEMIVEAALQEDVDAIGLSILSGAHMTLLPRVVELLQENGLDDVMVFAGGIIPDEDIPKLNEIGISGIFGPGTNTEDVITFVHEQLGTSNTTA
jgi:methylmalonyl-CoA mutase C-terminal domain/subunit